MKKRRNGKRENGAMALIAVFASVLFLVLTAIVIDGGLLYYKSAKLQNAVDASAIAVSHYIDVDDDSMNYYAKKYLKMNGFDKEAYGDDMQITIEKKGVIDLENPDLDDDDYINAGYIKLNVSINDSGLLAVFSGFEDINLNKTGYAKCSVDYVKMPQSMRFTIFAGSRNRVPTNNQYLDMSANLNGRVGGNAQSVINEFETIVNGVANSLIKPIIKIVGGNPSSNDVLNISTSEIVCNGDIHSNSDVNIGVQSIRSDRIKDADYDGEYLECICKTQCKSSNVDATCPVCNDSISSYKKCEGGKASYDDYNSVIVSASNIYCSSARQAEDSLIGGVIGGNYDSNTKMYVQNYQYLEQTQVALNIINTLDFSKIGSTGALRSAYEQGAIKYLSTNRVKLSDEQGLTDDEKETNTAQRQAIIDQKDNLVYNSENSYTLNNQKDLTYQITNGMTNQVLSDFKNEVTSLSSYYRAYLKAKIDEFPQSDSDPLFSKYDRYETHEGSSNGNTSYEIQFYKRDNPQNKVTLRVNAKKVIRDMDILYNLSNEARNTPGYDYNDAKKKAEAGFKFAVAKTYIVQTKTQLENSYIASTDSNYIPTPNLRPYFIRQINRSVRNATTSKASEEDSNADSATSIKQAVAQSSQRLSEIINSEKTLATKPGTNEKQDAHSDSTYNDNKYKAEGSLTNRDTSPLFRYNISQKVPGADINTNASNLALQTYGNTDAGHTSFMGEQLYKNSGNGYVLKNAVDFITDFRNANNSNHGNNAVDSFYNSRVNGKYGAGKVENAKNEFKQTKSYRAFWQELNLRSFNVKNDSSHSKSYDAPDEEEVFLSPGIDISVYNSNPYKQMVDFKNSLNLSGFESYTYSPPSAPINKTPVTIAEPSIPADKSFSSKVMAVPSGAFSVNGVSYDAKQFVVKNSESQFEYTVADLITNTANAISWNTYTVDNDNLTRCKTDGSSASNGNYHRPGDNKSPYKNVYYEPGTRRPYLLQANTKAYYTDYIHTGEADNSGLRLLANSMLLIGGASTTGSGYAFQTHNRAYLSNGSQFICNGNAFFKYVSVTGHKEKEALTIGNSSGGATVVVNGDLIVEGNLVIYGGSTLIVTGNLIVKDGDGYGNILVNGNSVAGTNVYVGGHITYADSSGKGTLGGGTSGQHSILKNGTTLVIMNNEGSDTTTINYALNIENGAKLYARGTIVDWNNQNGDGFVVENGGAVFVENLKYYDSNKYLYVRVNGSGQLYSSGTITCSSLTLSDSAEAYINAIDTISNITIGSANTLEVASFLKKISVTNYGTLIFTGAPLLETITNEGDIFGGTINATNLENRASGFVQVTGDLDIRYISNLGVIKCSGSINVDNGNLNQNSSNAFIYAGALNGGDFYISQGVVYVEPGNVIGDKLQVGNAILYVKTGSISVDDCSTYTDAKIYVGSDFSVSNILSIQTCDIKVEGNLSANSVLTSGSPRVDYASFGAVKLVVAVGTSISLQGGNMNALSIVNDGTVYVKNSISLSYLHNNAGGSFVCDGNVELISANRAEGHRKESLTNYGSVYIFGDLVTAYTAYVEGGSLYVKGDLVCSTNNHGKNALEIKGAGSKVYIGGWISSGNGCGIYVDESAVNPILSIYGFGHTSCIDASKISGLSNNSYTSHIYLGTGNGWEIIETRRTVTLNNYFVNNGRVFVYGNLECLCKLELNGTDTSDSKTIVAFDLIADDKEIICASGNGNRKHIVKSFKALTCEECKLYGDSEIYGYESFNVNPNKLYVYGNGIVFFGPDSDVNGRTLKVNSYSNGNFNGSIYLPGASLSATRNNNYSSRYTVRLEFDCDSSNVESFNGAKLVTDANALLNARITLSNNAVVYVDGKTTLQSAKSGFANNNGELYLIGGVERPNDNTDFVFKSGCVNYIGPLTINSVSGTMTFEKPFNCAGENYIENNVIANTNNDNPNKDNMVGNRWTSVYVENGSTHISGNLTIPNKNRGTLINEGAVLSCNDFSTFSSIYNYGEFAILGNITYTNEGEYSDRAGGKNMDTGICLKNGRNNGSINAMMYIGGSNPFEMHGYMLNFGQLYSKASIKVTGYYIIDNEFYFRMVGEDNTTDYYSRRGSDSGDKLDNAPRISIRCGDHSALYTSGSITTSNCVYTLRDAVVSCEDNLRYGMAILNGGTVYVKGNIGYSDERYKVFHIEVFYKKSSVADEKKGSYSIINGFIEGQSQQNENALFYCGGTLQVGESEDASNYKIGGTIQNWGRMYVNGNLTVYSNEGNAINKIAFSGQVGSETFVKGNCFSSGGFVTMKNTIFMCDGNLSSKRCARVNSDEFIDESNSHRGVDDLSGTAYLYVGGNMVTSTLGISGNGDLGGSINTWNYFIANSNSNIYVGGAFCTNSTVIFKQNVTLCVDGLDGKGDVAGFETDRYKFISNGKGANDESFEVNGNTSQFYRLIVRGSAYTEHTFRFRDMSKGYIYGDFVNNSVNITQNIEIGKSLSFSSVGDDTWARQAPFKTANDLNDTAQGYDYNYENACYFYVEGDFSTRGRLSVYAGATLKVGGDCSVLNRIQVSHDGNIYVGKDLSSTLSYIDAEQYSNVFARGDMTATNYIVAREHSILYCGKKVTCGTTFEGKTASTIFVRGSLQATMSNIKIRDKATVFVGGNMTALRYIELGKFDEKYRESRPETDKRTDDEEIGICTCTARCTQKNEDCPICKTRYGDCAVEVENGTIAKNELGDDKTDEANGATFFIGKALVSYLDYIREYGFSSVVVGKYVFANDYLTLRSNSDMWALPEAFNNNTYHKVEWVSESDGSILGNIIDKIREAGHTIKEAFTLKNGSVYSLGELTLNKNASLLGTWDCYSYDQTLMKHDALVYFGHDFKCFASHLQVDLDSSTPLVGFATEGATFTTLTCKSNTDKHKRNYTMYCTEFDQEKFDRGEYVCDKCGSPLSKVKHNVTCPVTIYANNEIDIYTTIDMRLTYLIACNGDVNMYDAYSNSDNIETNLTQLPNAVTSYNGNINYFAVYGKICSLFYAPKGNVNLDGFYQEIWGSCIGDTVDVNTYYLNMHRFSNWRTMNLRIAQSADVYLIPKKEFDKANANVSDDIMYSTTTEDERNGGASLFFDKSILDAVNGTGIGIDANNSALEE